jgi:DNA-binding LytR/AlgR family response regulator
MKVVIIEDEKPAVEKLVQMLNRYDPEIEVLDSLASVEQSVQWLSDPQHHADLLFMDIMLTDGMSFDIFEQIDVNIPIIFITAYNEFAIQAFKVNSIDYLLKPLNYNDLYRSMEKMKVLRENLPASSDRIQYHELNRMLLQMSKSYKARFMVKVGDHIRSVKSENVAMFYAEGRTVYMITNKQKRYIIDFKLESLETSLNPDVFFRPNRSFIVNINAISDVVIYSNSRLKILLNFDFEKEIIVSREKVNQLKEWFEGKD